MKVTWLVASSSNPMGMEHYEHAVQAAIRARAAPGDVFETCRLSSWRGAVPGTLRAPARLVGHRVTGPLLGRALGRGRAVHRFDLRLPPTAHEVVTVHDLPPARFDDEGRLPEHANRTRQAAAVIVPSSFAGLEVQELLGVESFDVVPNGVDPVFAAGRSDPALLVRLGVDRPFVVHAAGATTRKNLAGLAAAWTALADHGLQLVLCGAGDPRRTALFADLPGAVLAGALPRPDVATLMAMSAAVVVPSLYEGFGLPALEGMASGTPVVAAARGALPEVVGDAALLVQPDGEALADGLRRAVDDTDLGTRLRSLGPARAAGFTWERSADAHLAVYRRVFTP